MQNTKIIFQMATHHLPRIALRMESLLTTIQQACSESHPIIHNYALLNLIEILQLIQKPELKSRFLKELIRIEHAINNHKSSLGISGVLYTRLYAQIQVLNHVSGRFGEGIQNIPFLQSIQQIQTNQSKDCEENAPQLLLWLESNPELRQADLAAWLTCLKTLQSTITIYLSLIKNSAEFEPISLLSGFYQQSLPPKTACHLILLRLDKSKLLIPKMQIGHHGLSLRLLDAINLREINEPVAEIELAICQI